MDRWTWGVLVDWRWTGGLWVDWQTPGGLGGLRWTEVYFMGCAGDGRMGMDSIGVIWVCGGLLSTRIHIKRGC